MTDSEGMPMPVPVSPEVAAHQAALQAQRDGIRRASGPKNPAEIHADIAAAREQLGRTVEELAYRLDVPARTKERLDRARARGQTRLRQLAEDARRNPAIPGTVAGATLLVIALLIIRRVRKS